MEKQNSQCSGIASVNTESQWNINEARFSREIRCGSLSITTPVSLLGNEFDF